MILFFFARLISSLLGWLESYYLRWTRLPQPSPAFDLVLDYSRLKRELLIENAFPHQQLLIPQRQVSQPRLTRPDRFFLLLLASPLSSWRQTLLILKPETLLRWHRQGFQFFGASRRAPEEDVLVRAKTSWG